jgi:hypothetical protein
MNTRIKTILTLIGAAIALMGLGSTASAASFGSHVSPDTLPTYSTGHNGCTGIEYLKLPCTWLLDEGAGNPDGEGAPKDGKLKKIELAAGERGKFRLQIVSQREPDRAALLVKNGPVIHYRGQDGNDANGAEVETFKLHGLRVHQGDQLAIAAKHTSAMACGPMGSRTIGMSTVIYSPVLSSTTDYQPLGSANGCHLLIEGFVK